MTNKEVDNMYKWFGACDHCETVMCCGGLSNQCGCMGMPIDFKMTDACNNHWKMRLKDNFMWMMEGPLLWIAAFVVLYFLGVFDA